MTVTALLASPAARPAPPGPWPLVIANRSGAALECHAIAGHWYGFDLGVVARDASLRVQLSLQPRTGLFSLPNSLHQPVAIQMVYCGLPGDAWNTRAVIDLRPMADQGRHLSRCARADGGLACR